MRPAYRLSVAATLAEAARLDVAKIREDFPILRHPIHGKPLVYLDNGAPRRSRRS